MIAQIRIIAEVNTTDRYKPEWVESELAQSARERLAKLLQQAQIQSLSLYSELEYPYES